MPKEDLYHIFTPYQHKSYHKQNNKEWLTFTDWTTQDKADLITFYLMDSKVVEWGKEETYQRLPLKL